MAITLDFIRQLCMEGESSHLDYKRQQYPFVGVTEPEKAELLKDILAMANAFRTQTAYILIGITQQSDGSGKITGIAKDQFIDDASLQQFINGKLNRPIEFQSYSVPLGEKNIVQVIEIPEQKERPYYSSKPIGAMKPNIVEIRIGSSSRPATPDEIARMGKESQLQLNQRDIDISLIVPGNVIGDINFDIWDISLQGSPPVEQNCDSISRGKLYRPILFIDKFTYIQNIFRTVRANIGLENKSILSAEQLEIETFVSQYSNNCIQELTNFPQRPSEYPEAICPSFIQNISQTQILHPRQYDSVSKILYFKVMNDGDFTLCITVLGKDMQPIKKQFHITAQKKSLKLNANQIESLFDTIENESSYLTFLDTLKEHGE